MSLALIARDGFPTQPMRTEDDDGELEIERPEPIEDERELGEPVGSDSPWYPWQVTP